MRAKNIHLLRAGVRWLLALAVALSTASWAQEESSGGQSVSEPPEPPAGVEARQPEETMNQVRILRDEHGNLMIRTRDEKGDPSEVRVELGKEFGSALSQRIIEQLEEKGILDEKGLVVDRAFSGVPKNISIGVTGSFDQPYMNHGYSGGEDMAWITGVVAILAVFGTPVLIVWLVTRNSYRKKQLLVENINRMVVEGRDIPPELLDAIERESPRNPKDRGFTLIGVGLAIFIWLTAAAGPEVGSLGLIPLFIGIARFINWKLDNKQV